ncbi:MAG: fibronectin type III domain-containing protein, partial [Candidatus Thorarchaeota archaeon]|nr:fibronectin type III domain-containing protein [Candidatus Thorarchaeota archaeon]
LFSSLGSVLFFQDISMTPGTTYYYQITAVTPAGEGIPSVTFSAGLPASVPILEISIGVGVILLVSICFFYRRKKQT